MSTRVVVRFAVSILEAAEGGERATGDGLVGAEVSATSVDTAVAGALILVVALFVCGTTVVHWTVSTLVLCAEVIAAVITVVALFGCDTAPSSVGVNGILAGVCLCIALIDGAAISIFTIFGLEAAPCVGENVSTREVDAGVVGAGISIVALAGLHAQAARIDGDKLALMGVGVADIRGAGVVVGHAGDGAGLVGNAALGDGLEGALAETEVAGIGGAEVAIIAVGVGRIAIAGDGVEAFVFHTFVYGVGIGVIAFRGGPATGRGVVWLESSDTGVQVDRKSVV